MASPSVASTLSYNFEESKLLWTPSNRGQAVCERLRKEVNMKRDLDLKDYNDLHAYSVSDYTFWLDLWDFMGIISSVPPNPAKVIVPGPIPERPSWFPGTYLNYAENLLWRKDEGIAVTAVYERAFDPEHSGVFRLSKEHGITHPTTLKNYTFRELRELVRCMANAMRRAGVRVGDKIAAIITNSISGVVIALAATAIGAIFSSTSPDMGVSAVLDRYTQIRPKLLFASTESTYAGKTVRITDKIREVQTALREGGFGLETCVVLRSEAAGEIIEVPGCQTIDAFLYVPSSAEDYPLTFEQLPFDHPVFILYSSGTSGPPKCIVHCAGGALLNSKKDCFVGFGMLPTDVYFQYTTTGWMMWPFMLSALACGTRIVTYEGSPFWPDATTYLRFIDWTGVTVFGTSPRYLSELQARNVAPVSLLPQGFQTLREILVTGSVLTAQLMTWAHEAFGGKLHIGSTSGGTDVFCSCDTTYAKFRAAYFDTFRDTSAARSVDGIGGVWRHGDFVVRNPDTGGYVFLGRSDGVLNPSGVRFGSAEIYALLTAEAFPEVEDALCVGQRRQGEEDERVLLFLKMRQDASGVKRVLDRGLRERVRKAIREGLSRRHIPAGVFEVEDIPYTVNGKKIEIAVKQIVSGVDVTPSGTVANPESFKLYTKYRDLERVLEEEEGVDVGGIRKGRTQKAKL
ncbi:hypothetical protein ID866_3831 [Astraeus odoratus]|nr:hypothetical protein ID866_3831 [Astraeus odoratus]